jgi:hypothetical protein
LDSQYHPLRIEKGRVLVYDPGSGEIERMIVKWAKDRLVLKDTRGSRTTYTRRN